MNSINLLPVRSKDEIRKDLSKFKYDLLTMIIVMGVVIVGVILLFIQALFQYNITNIENYITTAKSTLSTYQKLGADYYVVERKVQEAQLINSGKVNPSDVIAYITSLIPSGATLSNFSLVQKTGVTVTVTSGSSIDVAKFLVAMEDPRIRLKDTEIREIDYSQEQNVYNFIISGTYVSNG